MPSTLEDLDDPTPIIGDQDTPDDGAGGTDGDAVGGDVNAPRDGIGLPTVTDDAVDRLHDWLGDVGVTDIGISPSIETATGVVSAAKIATALGVGRW